MNGVEAALLATAVATGGLWVLIGMRYLIDGTRSSCFNGCWFCSVPEEMDRLPTPPAVTANTGAGRTEPLLSSADREHST